MPVCLCNHLKTRYFGANSEDPDEMPHKAAFHQVLHCLLRQTLHRDRNTVIFGNFNF